MKPCAARCPLGGFGTEGGGHKGYGLGLLVDILCGVLSGGAFGPTLPVVTDVREGAISHWFGAFRVHGFRDIVAFKADMDRELRYFKECCACARRGSNLRRGRAGARKDGAPSRQWRSGARSRVARLAEVGR